jgi:hypothetical protein
MLEIRKESAMSADDDKAVLSAIESAGAHSKLVLRDGSSLLVDVSADGLAAHFSNHGVTLSIDSNIFIYYKSMQMTERDWRLISSLLRAHPEAVKALSRYKQITRALRSSFLDICELPYRIYSGISTPGQPCLYLSHPFDFYPKDGGHYCLLSERSVLIKCSVKYKRYAVEIEDDEFPGHFLQG